MNEKQKKELRAIQEHELDRLALSIAHKVANEINEKAFNRASTYGRIEDGVRYPAQYTVEKVIEILQKSV